MPYSGRFYRTHHLANIYNAGILIGQLNNFVINTRYKEVLPYKVTDLVNLYNSTGRILLL